MAMSSSTFPRVGPSPPPVALQSQPHPSRSHARSSLPARQPYALPFGTYRPGPPSIASTSTTSYAPSVTSTAATIVPSTSQQTSNLLRIKVDTNVAPSSHIWDEFYAESGGPITTNDGATASRWDERDGAEGGARTGVDRGSGQDRLIGVTEPINPYAQAINFNPDDTALSELLSMFELPHLPPSSDAAPTVNANSLLSFGGGLGDYPGAEFLNLPDTASTAEFPNYSSFDELDLSQFNFGSTSSGDASTASGAALNGGQELLDVQLALSGPAPASSLEISPLGLSSSNAAGATGVTAMSESTGNQGTKPKLLHHHQTQATTIPASGLDMRTRTASGTGTPASTVTDKGVRANNKDSSDMPQTHTHTCAIPIPNSSTRTTSGKEYRRPSKSNMGPRTDYPHLRRIEMRALASDKYVLRLQKDVLRVAAKFYTELAEVFESTPSDVIKLGMCRTGVLVEDDTVSEVLDDIKSLLTRLTAKAAELPGYPVDEDDNPVSHDEVVRPARGHTAHVRQGSAFEPIDLTAPTPRSEYAQSPVAQAAASQRGEHGKSQLSAAPSEGAILSNCEITLPQTSPPSRKRKEIDPFTPESLGPGSSSVPTTVTSPNMMGYHLSPMRSLKYPQPVAPRTSSLSPHRGDSDSVSTPTARRALPALPPLPSPSESRLIHGPWKPSEVERLRTLVAFSTDVEDGAPIDHVDWTWVVGEFGGTRNRHQVLIKAVEMGLRETSTHHSRRIKQKGYREAVEAMQTDLREASLKPISPLPSLLPSAQIHSSATPRSSAPPPVTGPAGTTHPRQGSEGRTPEQWPSKRFKGALDTPHTDMRLVRRQSDSSTTSELVVRTPRLPTSPLEEPPSRAIPRALVLREPEGNIASTPERDRETSIDKSSTTPLRPSTATLPLSTSAPATPKTAPRGRLSSMVFKAYAHPHPRDIHVPATAPPRSHTWKPWAIPGGREVGRASVISPTFGNFGMAVGYQLAPILDRGVREGRAGSTIDERE